MDYSIAFIAVSTFVVTASVLWIAANVLNVGMPVVYGRHDSGDVRWRIPTRVSWVVMEAPASISFMWFLLAGPLPVTPPILVVCVMWQMHYVHRAFIYPFQLQIRPGSTTPIRMTLSGAFFCAANGYLNGTYLSHYGSHLQSSEWFHTPAFIIGTSLFVAGFALNKVSDRELIRLRKQNPEHYGVPFNGAYRWVSCPNYLGEIIAWCGFSCAAWSIAGLVFAFMSASNLIPRAIDNHRWYQKTFPDYPSDRKAIIPFIL